MKTNTERPEVVLDYLPHSAIIRENSSTSVENSEHGAIHATFNPNKNAVWVGIEEPKAEQELSIYIKLIADHTSKVFNGITELLTLHLVPINGIDNVPSLAQWMRTKGKEGANIEHYYNDMCAVNGGENPWASWWDEHSFGHTVFTGVQLLNLNTRGPRVTDSPVNETLMLPSDCQANLTAALESHFGEGKVFISNQIQPLSQMLADWKYFSAQGSDRLLYGERFRKAIYDKQHTPAHSLALPFFGFAVSVRRDFPISFKLSSYMGIWNEIGEIGKSFNMEDILLFIDSMISASTFRAVPIEDCEAYFLNGNRIILQHKDEKERGSHG